MQPQRRITMSTREHSIKLVISHPLGLSISREIEESNKKAIFFTEKVGETIDGEAVGFPNHSFKITGGSDLAGFPHEKGIQGEGLRRVLRRTSSSSGSQRKKVSKRTGGQKIIDLRGVRLRKRVRGEELSEWTRQVNLVLREEDGTPVEEMGVDEIIDDKLLGSITKKIGEIILRWGLRGIQIMEDDSKSSLEEKFKEVGLDEEMLNNTRKRIGAEFLKLEHRQSLFNKLQKIRKSKTPLIGVRVAQEVRNHYNKVKNGEIPEEEIGETLKERITEILKKADEGNLKRKGAFSFNIEEEG